MASINPPQGAPATHEDIRRIEDKLGTLSVQVGQMMSRTEIEAEDEKRVKLELFTATMTGVYDRFSRLENGPQKLLGWLSLFGTIALGCGGVFLSTLVGAVTIVVTIIINHR